MVSFNIATMRLSLVEHELEAFREYHGIARRSFHDAAKKYSDEIEAEANERFTDAEDRNEYLEWYADEYQQIRDEFPDYLARSFVLMVYSFVEDELTRECKRINRKNGYKFDFARSRDRGAVRAQKFFRNVHNVKLNDADWTDLLAIGRIRNVLAHGGGEIIRKEDMFEIEAHVERFKDQGIKLDRDFYGKLSEERAEIIINDDYCYALLDFLSGFFKRLYTKI